MTEYPVESSAEVVVDLNKEKRMRVLHVDDELGLLKVAKQCLEMQGQFQVDAASSVEEAMEKMKKETYDAVVCDYQMPGKDGLEFLKELRQSGNAVPFVVFTGKGREEVAIKALNLGADGYFNKSGAPETVYGELTHGIRQVVEKKRASDALSESETKARTLLKNLPQKIFFKDKNSVYVSCNENYARDLKIKADEIEGRTDFDFYPKELAEKYRADDKRIMESGKIESVDEEYVQNKQRLYVHSVKTPVKDEKGNVIGVLGIFWDITENKKAEEALRKSERKYREFADSLPEIAFEIDERGNVRFFNRRASEILGYSEEDFRTMSILQFLIPQDRVRVKENIQRILKGEESSGNEYTLLRKDGSTFPVLALSNRIITEDGKVGVRGVIINISEQKDTEEKLRESEEKFRNLAEQSPNMIFIDQKGMVMYANKEAEDVMGYKKKEFCSPDFSFLDLIGQESRELVKSAFSKHMKGEDVAPYECRLVTKEGRTIDAIINSKLVTYNGAPAILVVVTDITARKKAEEKYRNLFELAPDVLVTLDMKGMITSCNASALAMSGYSRDEIVGKHFSKMGFLRIRDMPKYSAMFGSITRGKVPKPVQVEWHSKDGSPFVSEFHVGLIKEDGKNVGVQVIARDITERKRAEEVLQKSEESFGALLEEAPIGICNVDLKGKITYVNRRFEEAMGYSREEIVGKNGFKFGIMSGETSKLLMKRMKDRLMGKPRRISEGRFKRKDGEWLWAEVEGRLIKKFGVPLGFQLTVRDITERKRVEKERKHFEEKLSALNTYSRNLNMAVNMEAIYELTLEAAEKALGFEFADILMVEGKMLCLVTHRGRSRVSSLKLPLDGDKGITIKAAKTGKPVFVPDVSKEKAYVEGGLDTRSELAAPIMIGDNVLGVLNVESKELNAFNEKDRELLEILASHAATAISNLDRAEKLETSAREIRESQQRFEGLFMDNPEASVYTDSSFRILDINPRFCELFGYSLDEIRGKHIDDVIGPKDKTDEAKMLREEFMKGPVYCDTARQRKDGTLVPVSISAASITVEDQPIGYVELYRDITERKRYEERLSALNIYSRDLNLAESMEEIYRLTLDAMQKVLGFEYADFFMIDKSVLCIVDQRGYPEPFPLELPLDGSKKGISIKAVNTGNSVLVQDVRKNIDFVEGLPDILSELAVPIKVGQKTFGVLNVESKELNAFDEKDQALLEILASHAATAISNLEYAKNLEASAREIRESQQRFEGLFMDNPEAAVHLDPSFQILDVNPRFTELFGYSLDEVEGRHINDVIVPKDKIEEGEMLEKKALKGFVNFDTFRKRKDGSLVPVFVSAAPITVEGQIAGYMGVYRDITETKRYEERLSALNIYGQKLNTAESMEEIYRLTMDAVEKTLGFEIAFFMVVDEDLLRLVDHRGYPEHFSIRLPLDGTKKGVSVKVAKTGRSIIVPDAETEDAWVEFMPGIRSGLDVPVKVGHKVLGVIGVDSKELNAFNEKDRELLEILASHAATAISNLDHAENLEEYARETLESQQKFERLFMDNPEAAVHLDPSFQILDVNPRFTELFGYSLDEIRGKHINDAIVPNDKMEEAKMLDSKAASRIVHFDTVRKRKDGSLVPVSMSAAPLIINDRIFGHVAVYKDISELKKIERELAMMNEKLRVVGGLTRHDVRNKLCTITGNAYFLKKQLAGNDDISDKLKDMEVAVEQIVKIFDFAKAYEMLGAQELVYTNVEETVSEAVSLFSGLKGVRVINDCHGLSVVADSLLRQLFYNLIDNSLKHGQTTTRIRIHYEETNQDELRLVYEDDGIGIPTTEKPKLFKEGYSTGRSTGYGLYMIRKMTEVYGWTIQETGTPSKGAQFTITIPKTNRYGKENYQLH
jgi:PAS domain S-box-containing protein